MKKTTYPKFIPAILCILISIAHAAGGASAAGNIPAIKGEWSGSYAYPANSGQQPVPFNITFFQKADEIHGTITEPATFGNFTSETLSATFNGSVDSLGYVTFTKHYSGEGGVSHDVMYQGRLSKDGDQITGKWIISGTWSGTFVLDRK